MEDLPTKSKEGKAVKEELSSRMASVSLSSIGDDNLSNDSYIKRTRYVIQPQQQQYPLFLHLQQLRDINMTFNGIFDKHNIAATTTNRKTILRYNDVNPEIQNANNDILTNGQQTIKQDLDMLGYRPERISYVSDYYSQIYEIAIELIKLGKAYCCNSMTTSLERQSQQDIVIGKNRNTTNSIEQNLLLFEKMKLGMYDEGSYTLRLKIDKDDANATTTATPDDTDTRSNTNSNNNNILYYNDVVIYQIQFVSHPRSGNQWCIYPTNEFATIVCDSLERIDYVLNNNEDDNKNDNIITMELYQWILSSQLKTHCPELIYEIPKLKLQYNTLDRNILLQLIQRNQLQGWDDPRIPSLIGYLRRGYTADILNLFCKEMNDSTTLKTSSSTSTNTNTNVIVVADVEKLDAIARTTFNDTATRVMAVLTPVLVIITNWKEIVNTNINVDNDDNDGIILNVPNIPTNPSSGSHTIELTETLYIDESDFRLQDQPDYYGLAPNKAVGLKYYGGNLICDQVVMMNDDECNHGTNTSLTSLTTTTNIKHLLCRLDNSVGRSKPKTFISWIPAPTSISCDICIYNYLFTVPDPTDLWEDEINPKSRIVYKNSFVNPSVKNVMNNLTKANQVIQFERIGYFIINEDSFNDSEPKSDKLLFNQTVSLKEEIAKKTTANVRTRKEEEANLARKRKQKADLQAKEARMKIPVNKLFQEAEEHKGKFSKFDPNTGIPTHDNNGIELTKSAIKKLKKDHDKHRKQLEKL